MYEYRGVARRVHDGDTVTVDIDLGSSFWKHGEPLRLLGIQAPELNTAEGAKAQLYLADVIPVRTCSSCHQSVGVPVEVHTVKDKREKYGRLLADIFVDGVHLNKLMVDTGHAVAWDGKGPRPLGF